MAAKAQIKVNLPAALLAKLEPVLDAKGLTVDEVCSLYLRTLVTASERTRALSLSDEMPFGKFKGETLRVIIRAEPRYISWMLGLDGSNLRLEPEALDLLEKVLDQ